MIAISKGGNIEVVNNGNILRVPKNEQNLAQLRWCLQYLLAIYGIVFTFIGTVEKLAIKQLHTNYSKNKHEEQVNNQNIDDIFQWANDTIEYSFKLWHTFYCF